MDSTKWSYGAYQYKSCRTRRRSCLIFEVRQESVRRPLKLDATGVESTVLDNNTSQFHCPSIPNRILHKSYQRPQHCVTFSRWAIFKTTFGTTHFKLKYILLLTDYLNQDLCKKQVGQVQRMNNDPLVVSVYYIIIDCITIIIQQPNSNYSSVLGYYDHLSVGMAIHSLLIITIQFLQHSFTQ